jgi:hypothetical protein
MNRTRLSLVLLVLGTTAATAPAQYYPGYPNFGPQPPMSGAFPAMGMPAEPVALPPNPMTSNGSFIAAPPPAANGFSTPLAGQEPLIEPPYVPRIWAGVDYTALWVKRAPVPVPLVTTGSTADLVPGAIGQMGTMVVEGGHSDFGTLSTGRVFAGLWLDCDRCIGIEGNAFQSENAVNRSRVASNGSPGLYVPFFDAGLQAEQVRPLADPLAGTSGSASLTTTFQFRGGELNGLFNLGRNESCDFSLIAGVRYLRLAESLNFATDSTNPLLDTETSTFDGFGTRNEFYGGQLGGRLSIRNDCFFFDMTGKIALGPTYQTLTVNGGSESFTASTGVPTGTTPGGIFTSPTNIRTQHHSEFSVVPDLELKFGVNLGSNMCLFAAYDYLYWTEVLRPGDQMTHTLAPSPAPVFSHTNFWAQGVTLGLEIQF